MSNEKNLLLLIKEMNPELQDGEYVFCTTKNPNQIPRDQIIGEFKEKEGVTIIIERQMADSLGLSYTFIATWITLKIHSSLHAVGLTATFSTELAKYNVSCNVIAGYYHDHIFVDKTDGPKALKILKELSERTIV